MSANLGWGTLSSCLIPGPGVMRTEEPKKPRTQSSLGDGGLLVCRLTFAEWLSSDHMTSGETVSPGKTSFPQHLKGHRRQHQKCRKQRHK